MFLHKPSPTVICMCIRTLLGQPRLGPISDITSNVLRLRLATKKDLEYELGNDVPKSDEDKFPFPVGPTNLNGSEVISPYENLPSLRPPSSLPPPFSLVTCIKDVAGGRGGACLVSLLSPLASVSGKKLVQQGES